MTTSRPWMLTFAIACVAAISVGCSEKQARDVVDDVTALAARNTAASAGEALFQREGFELDGDLRCESASSGGAENVSIECTGTTTSGEAALLNGDITRTGEHGAKVQGRFVGSVGGREVFSAECLGVGC